MKTTKMVIGICSIVLTFLILFQSCAASVGDALANEGGTSGAAGLLVAIMMLIAGIVAIAARKSRGGAIFCTVLYGLSGLIGLTMHGIFADLQVWGTICLIFAVIFLISVIRHGKSAKTAEQEGRS